eukprot:3580279-Pyramimonas_sp.AAC.1
MLSATPLSAPPMGSPPSSKTCPATTTIEIQQNAAIACRMTSKEMRYQPVRHSEPAKRTLTTRDFLTKTAIDGIEATIRGRRDPGAEETRAAVHCSYAWSASPVATDTHGSSAPQRTQKG